MRAAVILLLFAPAPFLSRPSSFPAIKPGNGVVTWADYQRATSFRKDGTYYAIADGIERAGTWTQSKGVLSVVEWHVTDPDRKSRWKVTLSSPTAGITGSGNEWYWSPDWTGH